ncbi:MAG: DUF1844 domain-containing protein [Nitrospiraceae bacterium]|nr:DUF1844 domain-containing protein [Nitrospiraceae bacterium]
MDQDNGENVKTTDRKQDTGKASKQKDEYAESKKSVSASLPKVDFSTFILSLNTSALVHLGELSEIGSDKKKKDLVLAQQAIDTLAMLQEKSAGNLDKDEEGLLEHIIFDLRMKFIKASSSI